MSNNCKACGHRTTEVLDFGRVALAGAFLKPNQFAAEKRYPLTLELCEKCLLVQTGQSIPPATLFSEYFYFTSAIETMRAHFQAYAGQMHLRFHPKSVLEIGCNDGAMLRVLQKLGVEVFGVDPAANVTPKDLPIENAYFGKDFADGCERTFDLILANNVFAHIEDINGACAGVAQLLTQGGSFVFEVNRLDSLISGLQYDWIYHEHLFYYSLLALGPLLRRHGLEIYDLQRIATHAGSIRYFAARAGKRAPTKAVIQQLEHELWMGLNLPDTYTRFARAAKHHADAMRAMVRSAGRVAGYGACGRTNTMLQFCGILPEYIVDDAPAKQGFYTPGTHVPVVSRERLAEDAPDALIVFAWSFLAEIEPKLRDFAGKVYIPLPYIYDYKERKAA